MPLPLPVRKNIRDSEEKLKENLERIKTATDKEFTFEVDWEGNMNQIEGYGKENIGSLYHDEILSNLAYNLENACKDPLTKESLNEATSNNKITIICNPKINNYWNIKIENGDLIVEHKKSIANTSDVSYFDLAKVMPTQAGALPLKVRQDIESVREKQQELLESIAATTGSGEWVFEVDYNACAAKIDPSQKESIGSLYVNEILGNIDYLLKNKLTNPTLKEAFNEATSSRTITVAPNDKLKTYWDMSIKDGQLVVQHKPSICNTSDVSYWDLPKIIPIPGVMNLVAKLNLEANKEQFDEAMAKIKEHTGEEFAFDEACLTTLYEKVDASQKESLGSIIYADILPNLARNLENRLKDEMVKEAFLEITANRQITIEANPKQSNYWDIKFKDGNLIIGCKTPSLCNTSDVAYFDFEKLL